MNAAIQGKLSSLKESLGLPRSPVGIAFVDHPPEGVGRSDMPVPSACSFWRLAEQRVFYASEAEHFNCPIGVMTMGFQIPDDRREEAQTILQTMLHLDYITPEEASSIPSVSKGHKGIIYGPLHLMPVEPDVAVFFCQPSQAMLLVEASGGVNWKGPGITAMGRPTCAAIPVALQAGKLSVSMGCVGFRVYTGTPEGEMVIAVPGPEISRLLDRLDTIMAANNALREFHTQRRSAV